MDDTPLSNDSSVSGCSHITQFTCFPPPLEVLASRFPQITPNKDLDRSLRRCKLCDLLATTSHITKTELTSQTYEAFVGEMRIQIDFLLDQTKRQVRAERGYKNALISRKPGESKRPTDIAVMGAWLQCWGIWGLDERGSHGEGEIINEGFESALARTAEVQPGTDQMGKRKFEEESSNHREPKKLKCNILEPESKTGDSFDYDFEEELEW